MSAYNGGNFAHWFYNPVDKDTVRVLKRIAAGTQSFYANPFEVAYLISQECVVPNKRHKTLKLTNKGKDALDYFK